MDTKLKKSSKLAKFIIFLVILIPTVVLVSLYPRMEKLMLEKQNGYQGTDDSVVTGQEDLYENYMGLSVRQDMVNYAVEAAYYLYGRMLQEARNKAVNFSVLDVHGWINDYYTINEESLYYAIYEGGGGTPESNVKNISLLKEMNQQQFKISREDMNLLFEEYGIVCSLLMEFDEYGMISNIEFVGMEDIAYTANLYEVARNSMKQYLQNATYYNSVNPQNKIEINEMVPKKFKVAFLIPQDSMFVHQFNVSLDSYIQYLNKPERLYLNMGAPIVVLICMAVVALAALILPFFKKLNTGWETLFCLPLEIICGFLVAMVAALYLMFVGMCHTTVTEIGQLIGSVEILGYILETGTIYGLLLVVNVIGWFLCFGLEYTIVAHCRQFLCGPIYYFKHRILIVRFIGWIVRRIKELYRFIVHIDMDKGLHRTIVKVVLGNMLVGMGCCCFWMVGMIGVVLYALVIYVLLRKQGTKIEKQYRSIMAATKSMAEGELKYIHDRDLGVFSTLGAELEKVQEGFSKAVAEEAKSQKMKTELISNVSHDLKTPLTAMITYINLLKQPGVSEEERNKYIQTLDMKSHRLKVLIEDLFEVSKAQSGNIQMDFMDVDVVNIMKQLRLETEDKLTDSDLIFRWQLPEEKVILHLDGQKTYRVFENLLNNTLKYALSGSRVYIAIENRESEVEVIFKNISAAELDADADRLTDRFVRGDSARTTEGSGLGLAIVKSFVELQGGSFKIEIDGDLFKAMILWKK